MTEIAKKAGQELKSTNRPIYGASTITLNNTIYIYGGFYNTAPWDKEALWTLSSNTVLTQLDTDPFASPAVIYNTLQSIDNKTLYSFGGHLDTSNNNTIPEQLRYYKLNFDGLKWIPLQKKNATTGPLERFWHTTVQYDSSIYLLGGMNMTHGQSDFWKYSPVLDTWIELDRRASICGHTSTIANDGKMIVLGGFDCTNASFISPQDKILFPLNSASIYDTVTNLWYDQVLGGPIIPDAITFHTAIKIHDKIVICGGQDSQKDPFQTYMQQTAVLDINTWNWSIVPSSLYEPFPRSFAVASIVNETKMVYGLGLNYHTVYDGFYIFDIETNRWMSPVLLLPSPVTKLIPAIIAVASVLGALVCFGLLVYWVMNRHRTTASNLFLGIKKSIWNPRAGEPLWAEISRLLFRFSFLAIFIIISTVLVLQVENSPIIEQVHHDIDTVMMAPDIRFCFDGWTDGSSPPVIQCATDFGQSCSEHIVDMTQQVQSNLNYYGTKLACYLFKGSQVQLGQSRLSSNGSVIQFYYNGQNSSVVHVEFYHSIHDPNIPVYGIQQQQFDRWYSDDENAQFQASEQSNLKTSNVYNLDPSTTSRIGYQFLKREKMDLTAWNYIGFGTKRETMYQIQTTRHETTKKDGSLQVFPTSYDITVMREQRAFTVIHGMGIIGGIFGLMIGFQANLFGYRPRSPWGIVHRCSVGLMRKYLLDGLRSRFSNDVHIPIIHPVHRRYSEAVKEEDCKTIEEDDDDQRMIKLEERLHVFELLFQAYYIDDEVFRSLGSVSSKEEEF